MSPGQLKATPSSPADYEGMLDYFLSDPRAWSGYRFTVEHTLHVRANARGRGIGTRLLLALIERARALGKHVMVAGVDGDNAASMHLHERLGFTRAGRLSEVGYKFGRWLDLVFLQRSI
jgi:L-amino acid N-acyltransferase